MEKEDGEEEPEGKKDAAEDSKEKKQEDGLENDKKKKNEHGEEERRTRGSEKERDVDEGAPSREGEG